MKLTKSAEVLTRLRAKFSPPEYAFFSEVPAHPQGNCRRADGIAMGLWQSRGLYLTGFEIKVSRQDVLKELKDPSKADEIACHCDFWYLVLGDPSLIKPDELPENWGLILPSGKGLTITKKAPRLNPPDCSREFLASLLRRAQEYSPGDQALRELRAKVKDEVEAAAIDRATWAAQYEIKNLKERNGRLLREILAFEQASGVKITERWDAGKIAEAVKFIVDGGLDGMAQTIKFMRNNAQAIVETIDKLNYEEKGEKQSEGNCSSIQTA